MFSSPLPSLKIQIMGRKFFSRCEGKTLLGVWKWKVCWQYPAMFCLYISSKLFRPYFEFSLKVKGSNGGYFLKPFFPLNPLDKKLVNAITVYWRGVQVTASYIPTCGGLWTKFRQSSKLSLNVRIQTAHWYLVWNGQPLFIVSSQWGEIIFLKILLPLVV